ncbi:MAG: S8 family serine peptidase [Acidobacteria bacterium]|nr:S8 family serine peptidase [Acidobacteriota bacterium]
MKNRFSIICATLLFVAVWIIPEPSGWFRRWGSTPAADSRDRRVVEAAGVDLDGDRISDHLAAGIARGTFRRPGQYNFPPGRPSVTAAELAGEWVSLIVALDHLPTRGDVAMIEAAGGRVNQRWSDLVYAMAVDFPLATGTIADLEPIKALSGVVLIEENAIHENDLYLATKQTRARQVWTRYAVTGNPLQTVAVIDSGVSDTHLDLRNQDGSSRVVAWFDSLGGTTTPHDLTGHGTFVAGIIAGNGRSSGGAGDMAPAVHQVPVFASVSCGVGGYFGAAQALAFPVDTTAGAGELMGLLKWQNATPGFTNSLRLRSDTGQTLANRSTSTDGAQPLESPASIPAGRTSFITERSTAFRANATTSAVENQTPYWVQALTPMSSAGDGFNIMSGIAPTVGLVAIKANDDTGNPGFGRGSLTALLDGITYVDLNRERFNIVAVNMSLSFRSGVVATVDTVINNLVADGVLVVASAGNHRSDNPALFVNSPAAASRAIAVAAESDTDQITQYSSAGNSATGLMKPDVAAPGGSIVTGRSIMGLDTDSVDENIDFASGFNSDGTPRVYQENTPDRFPNDYVVTQCQGTSFAAPMVAGEVALIADALSRKGLYRRDLLTALWIKSIILMTATETNRPAEIQPDPTLDRGGKDISEGNGRINIEAAVEVIQEEYPVGMEVTDRLGTAVTDRKAFARQVRLEAGRQYTFTLTNPAAADFDLYLYRFGPDPANFSVDSRYSDGDPVIAVRSTVAGNGLQEQFTYSSPETATFALIVKRVAGVGQFTLNSSSIVASDTVAPLVRLLSPNGGDIVSSSQSEIRWEASDNVAVAQQEILFSLDDGVGFLQTVALNVPGDARSFLWTPPAGVGSTSARLLVIARDAAGNAGQDGSDASFTIIDLVGRPEVEPNDSIAQANALPGPTQVVGTIGRNGDRDYFSFDANAGATITITANAKTLTPPSVADTFLQLFDMNGAVLASNNSFGGTTDARLQLNAPAAGRYYFLVRENRGTVGGPSFYYQAVLEVSGGADTLAPSVAISAPSEGQLAVGTIALGTTVSDNVGVVAVQFRLDGVELGLESLVDPFRALLDTRRLADGEHVVEATARDRAGNRAKSAAVRFQVSNSGAPGRLLSVSKSGGPADFVTIQSAIDTAQSGDIITINDSVDYAENLIIGASKGRLTLRAAAGQRPTLIGRPDAPSNLDLLDLSGSNGVTIDGIRFRGGSDDAVTASPGPGATNLVIQDCVFEGLFDTAVILNNGSTAIVRDNRFIDLGSAGTAGAGVSIQNGSMVDLVNNDFTNLLGPTVLYFNNSTGSAIGNRLTGGLRGGEFADAFSLVTSSVNIYNNVVRGAGRFGIGIFTADSAEPVRTHQVNVVQNLISESGLTLPALGDGMQIVSSPNTIYFFTLVNNTIVNNARLGINFALQDPISRADLYNTIIYGSRSSAGDIFDAGLNSTQNTQITLRNCLIGKDTVFASIGRNGTIDSDPLFADPINGDFHLRPGSPAIDAGDDAAPLLPAADLQNLARIVDGDGVAPAHVDMGVYEFSLGTGSLLFSDPGPAEKFGRPA